MNELVFERLFAFLYMFLVICNYYSVTRIWMRLWTGAVWLGSGEVAGDAEGGSNHHLLPGLPGTSTNTGKCWPTARTSRAPPATPRLTRPLLWRSGNSIIRHRL